jgi:SAM-dependent methyltransferase
VNIRTLAKRVGWRRHVRRGRIWLDQAPDRLLGIDTAGVVPQSQLGFGPDRGNHYEASPWQTLGWVIPRGSVSPADVFVDLGCGKGRVVLLAARFPFRKVIGVELSVEVAEVARRNVARVTKHLVCHDVEIVVGDVAEYLIPDDATIAFGFNTVTGDAFSRLLSHINESLARKPRQFRLIYHNPTMQDQLRQSGWRELRRLKIQSHPDYRNDLVVHVPEAISNAAVYGASRDATGEA